ncbi:hypothetical protein RRG08_006104 [Elysia crispata]|uniref:Uncharacterized protein n=1 Tax=Elysia crispata TaxID=231223 RepID=A0AAE0Y953_9GAST|nr:hypothetical protein RRG08_006104 [Elysia crispata]
MMFFSSVLVALSVMGAFAADDDAPAACTAKPFTGRVFNGIQFRVFNTYNDFNNGLSMNDDPVTGEWTLIDLNSGFVYSGFMGTCNKHELPQDARVSPADIISQRKFEYSVSLPDGSELNAWSYTHGNAILNFLVNDDCVSVITSASLGGALAMSNYIFDVVTDNPDLSLLTQRHAEVQDVMFCP